MTFGARSGATLFLILLSCAAMRQSLRGQVAPVGTGAARDYVRNVYPFLGVDWGGNTFVGAAVPFGMVKLGPDMESFDGRPSNFGYLSGGRILGFSHTHLSGASGKYGNILIAPVTGALDLADIKSPRVDEVNHPGYYAATLARYNVRAELTSTRRVGFHRYTFPASRQSHLTVNIAHCLDKGPGSESQRFLGGSPTMKPRAWAATRADGTRAPSTEFTSISPLIRGHRAHRPGAAARPLPQKKPRSPKTGLSESFSTFQPARARLCRPK
jgi:hypothetical protein